MEQVRYKQRNCADQNKIEEFLNKTRIGTIGMNGDAYPYSVPVNFVWQNGVVYFHGMGSGKKVDLLSKNPKVCFTVFEEYGTVKDEVPCHADTSYMSVMIFGEALRVTDNEEGADALQKIVEKYMPDFYKIKMSANFIEKYRSSHDNKAVSIFCIKPKEMTAKENHAEPEALFNGGHHRYGTM